MNIDYPFHFDGRGRTAATGDDEHIRDMIEQFLFTKPGERVNRPDFGSGLHHLVFEPISTQLEDALKYTIQAGLQRWLNDVVEVRGLDVSRNESTIYVSVQYSVRRTRTNQTARFEGKIQK